MRQRDSYLMDLYSIANTVTATGATDQTKDLGARHRHFR